MGCNQENLGVSDRLKSTTSDDGESLETSGVAVTANYIWDVLEYNCLVVWNHGILWLSIQLGIIIPTDEVIFFRGVAQPPTRKIWIHHDGNQKFLLRPLRIRLSFWVPWRRRSGSEVVAKMWVCGGCPKFTKWWIAYECLWYLYMD